MKLRLEYLLIALFTLSAVLYVNIDRLPLTHPGNIKAADPFYHALAVEQIVDTKQWNYYDYYISLGFDKAASIQPPLIYFDAAILSSLTGLGGWVTLYYILCVTQALYVIVAYLISKELFSNDKISLLAAVFVSVPFAPQVWLYNLFIGLWLQVVSNFFILLFIWLAIRYFRSRERWPLFFIGVSLTAVLLAHPQDLMALFLPTAAIGIDILIRFFKTKKYKEHSVRLLLLGLLPMIFLLVMLPRILYVWGPFGGSQSQFGLYSPDPMYYNRSYSQGLVYPDLFFVPWLFLAIFGLGLLQISMNYRKYRDYLAVLGFYFFVTYLSPFIVMNPYYYLRLRSLQYVLIAPAIAYSIYYFAVSKFKKHETLVTWAVAAIIMLAALPQYSAFVAGTGYEHITFEKWTAYQYIAQNSAKTDKVLFFGNVLQSEDIYIKRITGLIEMDELQRIVNEYVATNVTPASFKIVWGGTTLREPFFTEKSFASYLQEQQPDKNVSISDFEFILFQDTNQQMAAINRVFINSYIGQGFVPVYNSNGFIIIKNEKVQN